MINGHEFLNTTREEVMSVRISITQVFHNGFAILEQITKHYHR